MTQLEFPLARGRKALLEAAGDGRRVRIKGVIAASGDGYNGRYRNRWLRVQTSGGFVEVTASPTSPLGGASVGAQIELTAELTGLLDVRRDVFYGAYAKLLRLR